MNTFTIHLQDATRKQEINGVSSFVGEDASGSFGVLADHARLMTNLVIGLARFRVEKQPWQYLALPGAVLYFNNNILTISTRHFLLDDDYMRISTALHEELLAEEKKLLSMKQSMRHMEEAVLKRLWEMGRKDSA